MRNNYVYILIAFLVIYAIRVLPLTLIEGTILMLCAFAASQTGMIEDLVPAMIENQSVKLDSITGATVSSA